MKTTYLYQVTHDCVQKCIFVHMRTKQWQWYLRFSKASELFQKMQESRQNLKVVAIQHQGLCEQGVGMLDQSVNLRYIKLKLVVTDTEHGKMFTMFFVFVRAWSWHIEIGCIKLQLARLRQSGNHQMGMLVRTGIMTVWNFCTL